MAAGAAEIAGDGYEVGDRARGLHGGSTALTQAVPGIDDRRAVTGEQLGNFLEIGDSEATIGRQLRHRQRGEMAAQCFESDGLCGHETRVDPVAFDHGLEQGEGQRDIAAWPWGQPQIGVACFLGAQRIDHDEGRTGTMGA